jgi:xanthosine utilization system XapX-like protein
MSVGEIAGLIAAIAFAVLVLAIAVPLIKLGSLLGSVQTEVLIKQIVPLLGRTQTTVEHVNSNLEHAETLTTNAADISTNARALTSAFSATLGGPLVKVAAFSYGVRRAAGVKDREALAKQVKADRKAARKARR